MTATMTEPRCPKCSGPLWDNRVGKKNPKSPDYKCKDKACDGVIWPPKNGAPRPAVAANAPQAYSAGPLIPGMDDGPYTETGAPPSAAPNLAEKLEKLFQVYDVCFDHAHALATRKIGVAATHEGIAAQAATLFIQAAQRGALV